MHNRKKFKKTKEYLIREKKKIQKYNELKNQIFEQKNRDDFTPSILLVINKLLYISPDFSTLWNYRRQIIIRNNLHSQTGKDSPLSKELAFTFSILKDRDIKSYGTWHHRYWLISNYFKHDKSILQNELLISQKVLAEDLRNFHCWNYRKKILKLLPPEHKVNEIKFLTKLFEKNPSNYSAWHNKSLYLSTLEDMKKEFNLCLNLFYTDPEDSSCWIFHHFLIKHLSHLLDSKYCKELLELLDENEKKWPLLTIVMNMERKFDLLMAEKKEKNDDVAEKKIEGFRKENKDFLISTLELLPKVDSFRTNFYLDKKSDIFIKFSVGMNLKKLTLKKQGITRFDSLNMFPSLTCIDLSENEILYIAELKNLSELEELNLEKNKIEFVFNLKEMKSLKILNLKDNLIANMNPESLLSESIEEIHFEGNPYDFSKYEFKNNFPKLK